MKLTKLIKHIRYLLHSKERNILSNVLTCPNSVISSPPQSPVSPLGQVLGSWFFLPPQKWNYGFTEEYFVQLKNHILEDRNTIAHTIKNMSPETLDPPLHQYPWNEDGSF